MAYGIKHFLLLVCTLACCWQGLEANLEVVQEWAELQFNFPTEEDRQNAVDKQYYVPGNSFPIDVDVHYREGTTEPRLFVTVPRFGNGSPVTLGTVDDQGRITGYPNYTWNDNQGENCNGLTSVIRVTIDKCNRLWVMDSGKIDETQFCHPQLLAFNLDNDELIYRHVVEESNYIETSLFVTPVADVRGGPDNCQDTFIYVADVTGFSLLIVDVANDRSWKITHRLFYPYPSHGTFNIDGVTFDLMDGVLGMALSPYYEGSDRYLYFHALASTTENIVSTQVIRNDSFISNPNADPQSINVFNGERPNQSAAEAMDSNGILYFGLMDPPSIWCWNSGTPYSQWNFHPVAIDRETLQFASGIKVVTNLDGEEELWVLTSSFQRIATGTINSDQLNYRIHTEKISDILANSRCARTHWGRRWH